MGVRAYLKGYRVSAQKARLVADQIRGKQVEEALTLLSLSSKRVARPIEKLVRSAVANLEQKSPGVDTGKLVLKSIQVNQAASLKRFRAATMGRVYPRLHRFCHVTVQVAEREE